MEKRPTALLNSVSKHFRTRLTAGLLVVVPAAITYLVLFLIYGFLADLTQPLQQAMKQSLPSPWHWVIPAAGVLSILLLIYLAGWLGTIWGVRSLVHQGHRLVERIPVVKSIYGAARMATEFFSTANHTKFSRVVMVEFPRKGITSIGLVTGTIKDRDGKDRVMVYVPTTPNPTSGYLVILAEEEVLPTDMTLEEAMRLVISGGFLNPGSLKEKTPAESYSTEEGDSRASYQ
ncbi:MAG: DUF502 domain-containing protein [Dehalococcoidia bacterium]